ncbi:DUF5719 family protein [Microcella alkaliphila]|uniref:Large extracellular alpha-helical protein n=1 Tax=Microcella alkaliphila TaxID=279828 RepID=A0A0U5BNH9_9MICO|nr:DUF5719 family protein [Microcella alkaliphila]BAU33093.1 uncharacterized protein MalAC0309_2251 [Microcella alkaliphila]
MTDARRIALASGRAGLSLLAAGAAVALGAAALLVPGPTVTPDVTAITVTPDRSDQTLACPGGVFGLTPGDNPQLTVAAMPRLVTAGTGATVAALDGSDALPSELPAETPLVAADPPAVVTLPVSAPDELVAAIDSVSVRTPDIFGFAAAECAPASRTGWLVGGDTTVGRTSWVAVANPGPVDATIDLALYGASGVITAPGTTGIIVPSGFQRVVAFDGLAVDQTSPIVSVTARAGSVTATLQTTTVRGLEPGGLSVVTAAETAATRLVIPGVPIIDPDSVQERATAVGPDLLPTLRLLAPGEEGADVTVRLVRAGAVDAEPEASVIPPILAALEGGTVLDLPLPELPAGDWAFLVDASAPVVAGVRVSVVDADPDVLPGPVGGVTPSIDQHWISASPLLPDGITALGTVGDLAGTTARLHLAAPADGATVDLDGRLIEVPAGGAVSLPVAGSTPLRITIAGGDVSASVSYRGDAAIATTRILAPRAATPPLVILPQ